jgi:hypothetical protein
MPFTRFMAEPAATFDCPAKPLTASATTAKPHPASPVLAASMAAFKASMFVWLAMSEMELVICPT